MLDLQPPAELADVRRSTIDTIREATNMPAPMTTISNGSPPLLLTSGHMLHATIFPDSVSSTKSLAGALDAVAYRVPAPFGKNPSSFRARTGC